MLNSNNALPWWLAADWVSRSAVVNHLYGTMLPQACFARINGWGDKFAWADGKSRFTLSFDCDTWKDAEVIPWLLTSLARHQLKGSFAVIGALVAEKPEAYRQVVDAGHEIICHGYTSHTRLVGETYLSDLFYEGLTDREIEEEIVRSREAVETHLRVVPRGFRTPHFGSFQQREQLGKLYDFLRRHRFTFSSSALMFNATRHGFCGRMADGFWEIPLSSRVGPPVSLVDSWNMVTRDLERGRTPRLAHEWNRVIAESRAGGFYVNIYLDPSQIRDYASFDAMLAVVSAARADGVLAPTTYEDAIAQTRR